VVVRADGEGSAVRELVYLPLEGGAHGEVGRRGSRCGELFGPDPSRALAEGVFSHAGGGRAARGLTGGPRHARREGEEGGVLVGGSAVGGLGSDCELSLTDVKWRERVEGRRGGRGGSPARSGRRGWLSKGEERIGAAGGGG